MWEYFKDKYQNEESKFRTEIDNHVCKGAKRATEILARAWLKKHHLKEHEVGVHILQYLLFHFNPPRQFLTNDMV